MDAQTAQQAHRDYMENRILSAEPVEIVAGFYQVAMDSLNAAIAQLREGDHFARARSVTKAEAAVDELILSLDHSVGASFTRTMADLYRYVLDQIIQGHVRQSEKAFREALSILTTLSSAWAGVRANVMAEKLATVDSISQTEEEPEPAQSKVDWSDPRSAYSGSGMGSEGSRDWSC
jgi:flagellar biosynthetic protein FliS